MDELNKRERIVTTLIAIALVILLFLLKWKFIQYCIIQLFDTYISIKHVILLRLLIKLLFTDTFTMNAKGD